MQNSRFLEYDYEVESSEADYRETRPGNPDFSRLLNGLPAYLNPQGGVRKKKKAIFINLNATQLYNDDSINFEANKIILEERCYERISEGHDCYIFQGGVFKKIDEKYLRKNGIFNTDPPSDGAHHFKHALAKFGLNDDQALLIDHTHYRQFKNGREEDLAKYLETDKLDLKNNNIDLDSLYELLIKKQTSVTALDLSGCLNLGSSKTPFPGVTFPLLKTLILGQADKKSPVDHHPPNHHSQSRSHTLPSPHLLISASPELSTLDLSGTLYVVAEFYLSQVRHPEKLKVLKMPSYIGNAPKIFDFLHKANNLRVLCMDDLIDITTLLSDQNCNFVEKLEELEIGSQQKSLNVADLSRLPALKKLCLKGKIGAYFLERLLDGLPALEELDLSRCPIDEGYSEIASLSLSDLKKLRLTGKISADSLVSLLVRTTNLEELDLSQCEIVGEVSAVLPLERLKILRLSGKLSGSTIKNLACQSTVLEEFNLSRCELEGSLPESLPMHSLKKFSIEHNLSKKCADEKNISAQFFIRLFNAPLLEECSISDCDMRHVVIKPNTARPNSLKKLKIVNGYMLPIWIQDLYCNTPLLEELSLSDVVNSIGALPNSLKILSVAGSSPKRLTNSDRDSVITYMLDDATALEELNFSDYVCNLDLGHKLPNLPSLRIVRISKNTKVPRHWLETFAQSGHIEIIRDGVNVTREFLEKGAAAHHQSSTQSTSTQTNHSPEKIVDVDAKPNPNRRYDIKPTFYAAPGYEDPDDRLERVTVADKVTAFGKKISLGHTSDDLDLKPCPLFRGKNLTPCKTDTRPHCQSPDHDYAHYYADHPPMTLTQYWQPLRSHKPNEIMTHYQVDPNTPIEIQYSERDHLYYIRLAEKESKDEAPQAESKQEVPDKAVKINFVVAVPKQLPAQLPVDIEARLKFYENFKEKDLVLDGGNTFHGEDYLQALDTNEVGHCGARSALFKRWFEKHAAHLYPDMRVYVVSNESHAFVEIFYEGQWFTCDFGGYSCDPHVTRRTDLGSMPYQPKHSATASSSSSSSTPSSRAAPKQPLSATASSSVVTPDKNKTHTKNKPPVITASQRQQTHEEASAPKKSFWNSIQEQYSKYKSRKAAETAPKSKVSLKPELEAKETAVSPMTPLFADPKLIAKEKKQYFESTVKEKSYASTEDYIKEILAKPHQNQCIFLPNTNSIKSLGVAFESYFRKIKKPFLHVRSADDLVCSSASIAHQGNFIGKFKEGPGGSTYTFIQENKHTQPVVIWDLSRTKPTQVVQRNTILDKPPSIDGIPLPKGTKVIVLMNPDAPNAYLGPDFISRLDARPSKFPENIKDLPALKTLPNTPTETPVVEADEKADDVRVETKERHVIHLFQAKDWRKRLIGDWVLDGTQLRFEPGELLKACNAFHPADNPLKIELAPASNPLEIVLNNAPWFDAAFSDFMQDIQQHGVIKTQDFGEIKLPAGIRFVQENVYPWDALLNTIDTGMPDESSEQKCSNHNISITTIPTEAYVLNPSSFSDFLSQYHCDNDNKTMHLASGILEEYSEKTREQSPRKSLPIYVSAKLTDDAWAEFLLACEKHKVTIQPILAPGVQLPKPLASRLEKQGKKIPVYQKPKEEKSPEEKVENAPWDKSDIFIESTDVDVTVDQIQQAHAEDKFACIDISELQPQQLFKQIGHTLHDGCDLYFMTEEPKTGYLKKYKHSYLLIDQTLHYVNEDLSLQLVPMTDPKFVENIEALNTLGDEKIHLSFEQVRTYITAQSDHVPAYETVSIEFEEQIGAVETLLDADKTVVLTGAPDALMLDALNTFMLKRLGDPTAKGKLRIVSNKPNFIPVLEQTQHAVTIEEKKSALQKRQPVLYSKYIQPAQAAAGKEEDKKEEDISNPAPDIFSNAEYEKNSLARLEAMLISHAIHKDKSKAYEGIHHLGKRYQINDEDLAAANLSRAAADQFIKARDTQIETALAHRRFVIIVGESGVGKTTSILEKARRQKELHNDDIRYYFGEEEIEAWAADKAPGKKRLVIDEANLKKGDLTQFAGLARTPPSGIMVGNTYESLSEDHEGIFIANPTSNGGERFEPFFFKEYGNTAVFYPLKPAVLYQDRLKPILELLNKPLKAQQKENLEEKLLEQKEEFSEKQKRHQPLPLLEELAQPFLKVYQFLTNCKTDEELITPRELTTMALYTVSYCIKNPQIDPMEVARYYAYNLSKSLVPEIHKDAFKKLWPSIRNLPRPPIEYPKDKTESVHINNSNREAWDAINDALDLRELLLKHPEEAALNAPGLRRVILQAEAGLGKSELMIQALKMRRFVERQPDEKGDPPKGQKYFYRIPASMPLNEKKKLLIRAFQEGVPDVSDEINAAPALERLRNELSGGTYRGKPAKKKGHITFGSQNPPNHKGRHAESNASKHRTHHVTIPHYKYDETLALLDHKGLFLGDNTEDMVNEYFQKRGETNKEGSLCFRELIKCAEKQKKGEKKVSVKHGSPIPSYTLLKDPLFFQAPSAVSSSVANQQQALDANVIDEEWEMVDSSDISEVSMPPLKKINTAFYQSDPMPFIWR